MICSLQIHVYPPSIEVSPRQVLAPAEPAYLPSVAISDHALRVGEIS